MHKLTDIYQQILQESSSKWGIRFLRDKNTLPLTWTYPGLDEMQGAQILSMSRGIDILLNKKDVHDDWYNYRIYPYVAFLEIKRTSGDHALGYLSILPKDLINMYSLPIKEWDWFFQEFKMEFDIENSRDFLWEYEKEFIQYIKNNVKRINPKWKNILK